MIDKYSGKNSILYHQKSAKSEAKYLTRYKISGKIHSFTASQLHSFTASQLHSFTAEGTLYPDKTIKDRQFFSHKKKYKDFKPIGNEFNSQSHTDKYFKSITHVTKLQSTPSVELRSSSQRIIKNVLLKTASKFLRSFAGTAVKLKYRGGCL